VYGKKSGVFFCVGTRVLPKRLGLRSRVKLSAINRLTGKRQLPPQVGEVGTPRLAMVAPQAGDRL
jgi:hypothetical protein